MWGKAPAARPDRLDRLAFLIPPRNTLLSWYLLWWQKAKSTAQHTAEGTTALRTVRGLGSQRSAYQTYFFPSEHKSSWNPLEHSAEKKSQNPRKVSKITTFN